MKTTIRSLIFTLLLTSFVAVHAQSFRVTFRIDMRGNERFDPAEHTVGVRGSLLPLSWAETSGASVTETPGVYETTLMFEGGENTRVQYKYKIEGLPEVNSGWENGPNRIVELESVPVTVSRVFDEPPPPIEPTFTGDIRFHRGFTSQVLGPRDVFVYLPPEYEENQEQYPVLYMHDGRNIFDASEVGDEWAVDETAERLIAEGKIEPLIIVGVGNTSRRTFEYTPTVVSTKNPMKRIDSPVVGAEFPLVACTGRFGVDDTHWVDVKLEDGGLTFRIEGEAEARPSEQLEDHSFLISSAQVVVTFKQDDNGGCTSAVLERKNVSPGGGAVLYARLLIDEIKPFIDTQYRTLPSAEATAVGGSSLGGLVSMYLGATHPEVFGKLLVVSPSVWWGNNTIIDIVRSAGFTGQKIWLDMGTAEGEGMVTGAEQLNSLLEKLGWEPGSNLRYVLEPGATHSEGAWARRVEEMLLFLYGSE